MEIRRLKPIVVAMFISGVLFVILPVLCESAIMSYQESLSSICEYTTSCACRDGKLYCRCDQYDESVRLSGIGRDYLPTTLGSIVVENCTKVFVASRALEKLTPLRSVTMKNIGTIYLESEAFSWDTTMILEYYNNPGIDIRITNSTIMTIPPYSFKGHLNSVVLERVKISTIAALAFSNIAGMEKLELTNCDVEAVEPQAFKKFIVDTLKVYGGSIEVMPSHSLNSITVRNKFQIEGTKLGYLRSAAIKVEGPRIFELRRTKIQHLEGGAFRVTTHGPVYIEDNSFPDLSYGVFTGITADPRYVAMAEKQELFFENNTVYRFADSALLFNTSGLKPTFSKIIIDRPCSCHEFPTWTTKLVKFTTLPLPLKLERKMWCSADAKVNTLIEDYERKHCITATAHSTLIVFGIALTLIALIAIAVMGFYFYRRHTKKYLNVPTNEATNNRLSILSTNSNHLFVKPDGKVYRETELHIVEERLTPIAPTNTSQHV